MKLQYTVVSGVRGRHPHNSLNAEHNLIPLRVGFAKWGLRNIFGYIIGGSTVWVWCLSMKGWSPIFYFLVVGDGSQRLSFSLSLCKLWDNCKQLLQRTGSLSVWCHPILPVGQLHWSHKHQRNLHWLSRVLREERGSILRDKSSLIQKRRSVRVSVRKWNRSLQELLRNASKVRKENNTEDGKGTGKQAWENWASS